MPTNAPQALSELEGQLDDVAEMIDSISEAAKRIQNGKLNDRMLAMILSDATGLSKTRVLKLLMDLSNMKPKYRRKNHLGQYV